jgi:hypothetical protein
MTRFFASFTLVAVAFALAPQALKAANPLCPLLNATKHGTYINSDCTGTSLEAGAHYSFVVSPDGNTTTWMETDPGTVVSGTEVRLKPAEPFKSGSEASSSGPKSSEKKHVAEVPVSRPAMNRAILRDGNA